MQSPLLGSNSGQIMLCVGELLQFQCEKDFHLSNLPNSLLTKYNLPLSDQQLLTLDQTERK